MTKTKRAAVAVACVAGAALGALGSATPAFAAGTGTATYNCSYTDPATGNPVTINGVATTWQHGSSGNLTIKTTIASPQAIPIGGIKTTVSGVVLANAAAIPAGGAVQLGPSNVPGSITGPPNPLVIQIVGPPAVTVTCALQNPPAPGGWPI